MLVSSAADKIKKDLDITHIERKKSLRRVSVLHLEREIFIYFFYLFRA